MPANRFWLSPTAEHQRVELLKAAYATGSTSRASPVGQPIEVLGWADVVDVATITEPEHLDAIDSKLIWSRDYVESRFAWKRRDPLWVLVLRVHRLDEPQRVPWRDEYGGCTSWVTYEGLPADPGTLASHAVLSDVAFEAKRKGVRESLPAECWRVVASGFDLRRSTADVRQHCRLRAAPGCSGVGFGRQLAPQLTIGPVAAVARLGERVGPEGGELLGGEELVDRGGHLGIGIGEIEVVHDLVALVTDVAVVLETRRPAHTFEANANRGMRMHPPALNCVGLRRASTPEGPVPASNDGGAAVWIPLGSPVECSERP